MPLNDNDYNLSGNIQKFLKGTCRLRVKTDDNGVIQFDFNPDDRQNYGTVTVTPYDGVITLYYNKSVSGNGREWGDFVKKIKNWAFRNGIKEVNTRNIDDYEHDMKDRERTKRKEGGLLEGWHGNSRTSWSDSGPSSIKMIVKHNRAIGEGDQRYRHVDKIFLETEVGERLLLPTKRPSVGRVYARHLAEGGEYNDDRWRHINELSEDISKLGGFVRATRNRQFNESVGVLVSEAHHHYYSLKETIRKLQGSRGYNQYFESWKPAIMENDDEHDYAGMFRNNNLDHRIEAALPVLQKLKVRVGDIREAEEFENWANGIVEDHTPIEHNNVDRFVELMKSEDLSVGPDAMNVTGQLEDIIEDGDDRDQLFNALEKLAETPDGPNMDAKPIILSWLQFHSEDNFYKEVLQQLDGVEPNEESSEEELPPPESSPAETSPQPAPPQAPPVAGGAPGAPVPTLEEGNIFEKKNPTPAKRNPVAKYAKRSGAGAHTKKGFQRHDKHKRRLGEDEENEPRIREYKDSKGKCWWEVLDSNGHRVSGQGTAGFDSVENAKELYKSLWNSKPVIEKLKEDVEEDIGILNRIKRLSGI